MTVEDILKTPIYLRANGQWTRSSYISTAELLRSLNNNDDMLIIEPTNKDVMDTLTGYCLVQGINIEYVKTYRTRSVTDYIYKIGDL